MSPTVELVGRVLCDLNRAACRPHSDRRAIVGSTRAARQAGTAHAVNATALRIGATPRSVRVGRRNAEQVAADNPGTHERHHYSCGHSGNHESRPFPEHEPNDVSLGRPDRHPYADFVLALTGEVRRDAIQADCGEGQCEESECARGDRRNAHREEAEAASERLCHGLYVIERQVGRECSNGPFDSRCERSRRQRRADLQHPEPRGPPSDRHVKVGLLVPRTGTLTCSWGRCQRPRSIAYPI